MERKTLHELDTRQTFYIIIFSVLYCQSSDTMYNFANNLINLWWPIKLSSCKHFPVIVILNPVDISIDQSKIINSCYGGCGLLIFV